MRKAISIVFLGFFLASCGSIRINPKGCKTKGQWGNNPLTTREITDEELSDAKVEVVTKSELMVFSDEDIRLRDILEKAGIKCEEIKKLRLQIDTYIFFKRVIQIKVVKF